MSGDYDDRSRSGGGEDWSLLLEPLDFWRLCDEFSVIQAALLIVGENPAGKQDDVLRSAYSRPMGFDAAFAALRHATQAGRLRAVMRRKEDAIMSITPHLVERVAGGDGSASESYTKEPDWNLTTITLDDLRAWLRGRGISTGFFFPKDEASADYLNPSHAHYSSKLAATIRAWEAVSRDPSATRGKTVKQAIMTWLRRHADQYGLTKDDGSPNEQGIEEISKIANWDTKGGAPKTPGE